MFRKKEPGSCWILPGFLEDDALLPVCCPNLVLLPLGSIVRMPAPYITEVLRRIYVGSLDLGLLETIDSP